MLVVVDQPNNIGRLTVAVAQDAGATVRYLPGLAMRQLSRIHAGNSKTDIRDAFVIAHAGANLPDALRNVDRVEEVFLQLQVLNGIDEDLARSYTRLINQIRSALGGDPTKMRRMGKARVLAFTRTHKARNPEPIVDALFASMTAQTVTIPGAHYAEMGIAMSAADALAKLTHRKEVESQVLELIKDIPHTEILLSMPGIGPRSAAQILMTAGDMSDFPTAGHLAS